MSPSRYVITGANSLAFYNRGCDQGRASENMIIVLDFGAPEYVTSTQTFGTTLPGHRDQFMPINLIEYLSQDFLQGYYDCSSPYAFAVVAIGTNNCGHGSDPRDNDKCVPGSSNVSYRHGQAWLQAVKYLAEWVASSDYATKLAVVGASDIEPGYNYTSTTRTWIDGYYSTFPTDTMQLYNFGSCDACPTPQNPNVIPAFQRTLANGTVLNWSWSMDDIIYVSYGTLFTSPLPDIYAKSGVHADQWHQVAIYAYTHYSYTMDFVGTFTQWTACHDPNNILGGPDCINHGLDNTASEGWLGLYRALNSDPIVPAYLDRTATDVTWQW